MKAKQKKLGARLKAKWVKALRSGEYEQGIGLLHDADRNKFCCLGVLLDIIHDPDTKDFWRTADNGCGSSGYSELHEKHGISCDKFVAFNDEKNKSFNWIASYIDRYL